MAGIIAEEPPSNGKEMQELIGEFIQNGNKLTALESEALCNDLA